MRNLLFTIIGLFTLGFATAQEFSNGEYTGRVSKDNTYGYVSGPEFTVVKGEDFGLKLAIFYGEDYGVNFNLSGDGESLEGLVFEIGFILNGDKTTFIKGQGKGDEWGFINVDFLNQYEVDQLEGTLYIKIEDNVYKVSIDGMVRTIGEVIIAMREANDPFATESDDPFQG